jgi:hypothetical protein
MARNGIDVDKTSLSDRWLSKPRQSPGCILILIQRGAFWAWSPTFEFTGDSSSGRPLEQQFQDQRGAEKSRHCQSVLSDKSVRQSPVIVRDVVEQVGDGGRADQPSEQVHGRSRKPPAHDSICPR